MFPLLVPVPVVENVVWHSHLLSNLFVDIVLFKMEVVVLLIKKVKLVKVKMVKVKMVKLAIK